MKKYFIASLLVLPAFTSAQTTLQNFDMRAFSQCQAVIKKCPQTGPVLDAQCVSTALNANNFCEQLSQISKETNVSADQIDAKSYGNVTLLSLHYPADGKVTYSVIGNGQIINMNADLSKTNIAFLKKYQKKALFSVVTAKPAYVVSASGDHQFIAPIRITKGCAACEILGVGKVIFHFDAKGKIYCVAG